MKRLTREQWAVFATLVVFGAGLRLYFRDIPNFAPVAALALFAGYVFPSRIVAILAPVSVMLITDSVLGGYQPALMLTVYSLLALPVLMRGWLRHSFQFRGSTAALATSMAGLLTCTLAASLLFFAVTNLVTWWVTPWYSRTWAGLWQCYVNAVPFFRYTLAGDVAFSTVLFGCYAIVRSLVRKPLPRPLGDAIVR